MAHARWNVGPDRVHRESVRSGRPAEVAVPQRAQRRRRPTAPARIPAARSVGGRTPPPATDWRAGPGTPRLRAPAPVN